MDFGCFGAPFEVKFASDEAKGQFEGYGAVFGNVDDVGDLIEPGAFSSTLAGRKAAGSMPDMFLMHGKMMGVPHVPVGTWDEMHEDGSGLYVKGRIAGMDTEQGRYNYALVRDGALRGLSIGFKVMPGGSRRGSGRPGEPVRFLKALHVSEVSLVGNPANAKARFTAIKAETANYADEIKTIRDFEEFLRDVGKYSHAAARLIASSGFKAKPEPRDEDGISDHIAARFRDLASVLTK